MKLSISLIIVLLWLGCPYTYGQLKNYSFKREIHGITAQWHKIVMPDELFAKTNNDLSDMRIFGITPKNDTIEAPYLMQVKTPKTVSKEVAFKLLNVSNNRNGFYYTFEVPAKESINQVNLQFGQQNFDWLIKWEGSQNQQEWFTISDNYRMLSIKNELTNFQFTNLVFPDSKFRYYRLFINSKQKPELTVASIAQQEVTAGVFRNYPLKGFDIQQNKQTKQSVIDIELERPVPISHIELSVKDSFDYYRPVTIDYITDSFKTEKGWQFNYSTLASGMLNSLEKSIFHFSSTTTQKLKIFIENQDNQPLNIYAIQVKGYEHELLVRFTEPATYLLAYGSKTASKPNYDIDRFVEKVPATVTALELGKELTIESAETAVTVPLFENKTVLWAIMGLIILVLGWFSLKMIRKK